MRWASKISSMVSRRDGISTGSIWLDQRRELKPSASLLTTEGMKLGSDTEGSRTVEAQPQGSVVVLDITDGS